MQRKFKFALCIFLAIVALLCTASAADIYVAADGDDTAAGTADAPVATLTQAYTLLGADGGTVLLADTVPIAATSGNCYIEPTHNAKITVTSAPDANGALDLTGIAHFHFSGETEWNSIGISANEVVLTADNNIVTMGQGLTVSSPSSDTEYRGGHRFCGAKLHLAAYAPCDTANRSITTAGGRLNVYSGEYRSISAWYGSGVTLAGGKTQICFGEPTGDGTVWVRRLCPGLIGTQPDAVLSLTKQTTVELIVLDSINAVETYRSTQHTLDGNLYVSWLLRDSIQGDATAVTAWDAAFAEDATCTMKVYASEHEAAADASAALLLRSTPSTGTYTRYTLSDYVHAHEIYTASDGRLLCCLCGYEQCRHRTQRKVEIEAATCKSYALYELYCDDLCGEHLLNPDGTPKTVSGTTYNSGNHVGRPKYSSTSTAVNFICEGCKKQYATLRGDGIGNRIILGEGGIDYLSAAQLPKDGSPLHFATFTNLVRFLRAAKSCRSGDLTIEIRGAVEVPNGLTMPVVNGHVTIEGADENAVLYFDCYTKRIRLSDDTTFRNIGFCSTSAAGGGIIITGQNHKLVMDEGIRVQRQSGTLQTPTGAKTALVTDLHVVGGFSGGDAISDGTGKYIRGDVTVRSGYYRYVGGFNFNSSTNDGNSKITIGRTNPNDTLHVDYLCPFSRGDGYLYERAECTIIVDGYLHVDRFYVTTLNKATDGGDYITNVVLRGDIRGGNSEASNLKFDIRGTNENQPLTTVNVYTDARVATAIQDSYAFIGSPDGSIDCDPTLGRLNATVNTYSYEDYCKTCLGGHIDHDNDTLCDTCGYDMNAAEE